MCVCVERLFVALLAAVEIGADRLFHCIIHIERKEM